MKTKANSRQLTADSSNLNQRILQLAELRESTKAALECGRAELAAIDEQIIALVNKHGAYPPKATRTKMLSADDGTELRVTTSQEIRVDGSQVLRLRAKLAGYGLGRIFRKLFRPTPSYVTAAGAHQWLAGLQNQSSAFAKRHFFTQGNRAALRRRVAEIAALFNAAISEEDKTPAVEVRRPEKETKVA